MIIPNDNQEQLPLSIVNDSSIAHLSEPSPLKFPQISRNIRFTIYIRFSTNYLFRKQRFDILDQVEMINVLKFLLTLGLLHIVSVQSSSQKRLSSEEVNPCRKLMGDGSRQYINSFTKKIVCRECFFSYRILIHYKSNCLCIYIT